MSEQKEESVMSEKQKRFERIPYSKRTKEQQEAISRYCKTAHPTNVPKDLDAAVWSFSVDKKTGRLNASLFLGGI